MWQPKARAGRWALTLVLLAGASACRDEPRRHGDYLDTGDSPAQSQCDLPLDQRAGGWFCYDG